MQQEQLSERIGTLVTEVDLTGPFTDEVVEALLGAMRERKLLVFRAAELSAQDQARVVDAFANVWDELGDGSRHFFVSNARAGGVLGRPDGLLFHSDCLYMPAPLAVLSLYAIQSPMSPSPTVFANSSAAAGDLPPNCDPGSTMRPGCSSAGSGGTRCFDRTRRLTRRCGPSIRSDFRTRWRESPRCLWTSSSSTASSTGSSRRAMPCVPRYRRARVRGAQHLPARLAGRRPRGLGQHRAATRPSAGARRRIAHPPAGRRARSIGHRVRAADRGGRSRSKPRCGR